MQLIEQALKEGHKLYASFEQGKYHVRLTPKDQSLMATIAESEHLLEAILHAVEQLRHFEQVRFGGKKVQL